MAGRRLPRAARRDQMLEAAASIVRTEGADALTLARVAEEAGVTRPIAYEHFETRAGLLVALYHRLDERQAEITQAALRSRAETLEQAVGILAAAYVDCGLNAGPEFAAIIAALSTMIEMDEFLRAERERYADLYLARLARFLSDPASDLRPIMLGVIAAADVLAREAIAARLSRGQAVDGVRRIMLGALRPDR